MVVGREDMSCKGGMLEPVSGLCLREKREMENSPGGSDVLHVRQYIPILYNSFLHAYKQESFVRGCPGCVRTSQWI